MRLSEFESLSVVDILYDYKMNIKVGDIFYFTVLKSFHVITKITDLDVEYVPHDLEKDNWIPFGLFESMSLPWQGIIRITK